MSRGRREVDGEREIIELFLFAFPALNVGRMVKREEQRQNRELNYRELN